MFMEMQTCSLLISTEEHVDDALSSRQSLREIEVRAFHAFLSYSNDVGLDRHT
jgi:hypothetical protein